MLDAALLSGRGADVVVDVFPANVASRTLGPAATRLAGSCSVGVVVNPISAAVRLERGPAPVAEA